MPWKPSDPYVGEFTTCDPATGAARDADSLPTAIAARNGTDDAGFALTCAKVATGRYKIAGTVPAGYAAGDSVQVVANATVAAVAGSAIIDSFVLDRRLADVISGTGVVVATVNDKAGYSLSAAQDFNNTGQSSALPANVTQVNGTAAKTYDGTARAGGASSITLATSEPPVDDLYKYRRLAIVGGTGAGQARIVAAYNGTTKVATVDRAWAIAPDATSQYQFDTGADSLLIASGLDNVLTEGSLNARQTLALVLDIVSSYLSGSAASGGRIVVKDPTNTATRFTVTGDAFGNRSNPTYSPPA